NPSPSISPNPRNSLRVPLRPRLQPSPRLNPHPGPRLNIHSILLNSLVTPWSCPAKHWPSIEAAKQAESLLEELKNPGPRPTPIRRLRNRRPCLNGRRLNGRRLTRKQLNGRRLSHQALNYRAFNPRNWNHMGLN